MKSEEKLLINTQQWFSEDKKRPITVFQVQLGTGKKKDVLFKTYSQVQLLLFLRDYWYTLNDWEIPHDNLEWEEAKAKYGSRSESAKKKAEAGQDD